MWKQVKVEDLDQAVRRVEDTLRDQIKNRNLPPDVLKEIDGGGIGISQGIQDSKEGEVA